jgi:hypothetical protein
MRQVSIVDYFLSISDDPDKVIQDLMECVLPSIHIDEIEQAFAPDGKGHYTPTIVGARRVHDVKNDLPRYMWDNPPVDIYNQEIWIIENDPEGDFVLIEGNELRYLIRESKRLREERDKEFLAKYGRPLTTGAFQELKKAGVI